ncbi:ABC transporter substrate-binding protein [Atribacter laminatus]|jgi:multiple sugar transport system substrate-binding protein|uniref:Erythritol/L-threitol-binding protein n=1 Tax=Atribacter laminatus TaxID=2847778 RepID=A0A7T1AN86_ATRLM|nr:sugar ABC transporter substrate-binding protein [Atribacter laminatus]QPM69034.1 Erythritol/L-threitol-binding protein [Atribacter laminatus]
MIKKSKKSVVLLGLSFIFILCVSAFASDLAEFEKASINWRQKEGERLLVGMNKHGFTDAIQQFLPEFEQLTGIKVTLDVYPEEEFRKKRLVTMAGGGGIYDVFMIDQALYQYAEAGWVEPLMTYIENPDLTDNNWYDFEDIFDKARGFGEYKGVFYALPITGEAEILFYRSDLNEEKGLAVPQSMDELYENAKKLKSDSIAGIVLRGQRGWGANVWPWSGFLWTYDGRYFDADDNPAFNSPEAVAATEMYAKLLIDAGPQAPASYNWYEVQSDIALGKAAMGIDTGMFMAVYEDPEKSEVAGKMGYITMPGVNGKKSVPNFHYWQIAMDPKSVHKEAAWLFIQWATSKNILLPVAVKNGTAPRASIWNNEEFLSKYSKEWAEASSQGLASADPSLVPYYKPEFSEFGEILSIAISDVITQTKDCQEALNFAVEETKKILNK